MSRIKILINNFEHEDCEKPLTPYLSGIIETPIGRSNFYSTWEPGTNSKTIRISNEEVRKYVLEKIGEGLNLENIEVDLLGDKHDWPNEVAAKHLNIMPYEYQGES